VVFPALVLAAASAPEPGRVMSRLYTSLGAASYPLYALHKPLGEIVVLALHRAAPQVMRTWPVSAGVPYLAAVLAGCILIERYYDRPARQALARAVQRLSDVLSRWRQAAAGRALALVTG
jgi:peptidoglycan/LPS O-acetylase OafA/YrhL